MKRARGNFRVRRYRPPMVVHRLLGLDAFTVIRARVADAEFSRLVSNGWAVRNYSGSWDHQSGPVFCNYVITGPGRQVAYDLKGRSWE